MCVLISETAKSRCSLLELYLTPKTIQTQILSKTKESNRVDAWWYHAASTPKTPNTPNPKKTKPNKAASNSPKRQNQ
jgi:hypothetical protein